MADNQGKPVINFNLEFLKDPFTNGSINGVNNTVGKRTVLEQNLNYQKAYYPDKSKPGQASTSPVVNSVGLPLVLKENPSKSQLTETPELRTGVPSFINPYAILSFPSKWGRDSSPYNVIIDDPSYDMKFSSPTVSEAGGVNFQGVRNMEPTVYNLVNTPPDGTKSFDEAKTPYRYTDFLYCKFYGKIPNNYLVTLRRYPAPTYDNLAIPLTEKDSLGYKRQSSSGQSEFKPIAQAVTWLGEETENKISDLLGFEVNMNWKKFESAVESVYGNEQDADEGPQGAFSGAAKFLAILNGQTNSPFDAQNSRYDPYQNGPYSHRVYGPVNVIASTYKRDRGLDFKQSFTVNFHYSLKSIASINPKAAMLDIMGNMLMLTYNNAAFWGGANRYFANKPVMPFLGGPAGMNAWYRGDPVAFSRAVGAQLSGAFDALSKLFSEMMADPIDALKKLVTGGASLAMKIIGKGRAPDIVAMKALLTGEPIGEWHMVVGNPYSPIMRIGNLICTGAKFSFNDTLGADNFPTELKVAITLEHGRPRDKGDIESMFNDGNGRIYFAPASAKDAFNSSAQQNSRNDNSYSKKEKNEQLNKQIEIPRTPNNGGNAGRQTVQNAQNKNASGVKDNKVGNSNFNQIVDNLSYPFSTGGHALAIKMGLASAGEMRPSSSSSSSNATTRGTN